MMVRNRDEVEAAVFDGGEYRGVHMRVMVGKDDGAPTFSMRVFTLAAGGHTPHHRHQHEHEVYILKGSGTLRSGSGERRLHPGDAIYLGPQETHQFRAGSDGLELICCVPHH